MDTVNKNIKRVQLKISDQVIGHPYTGKRIQAIYEAGGYVVPKSMIVFNGGDSKPDRVMIIFEKDSTEYKLMLEMFKNPPSIKELMKVLPYEVREEVKLKIREEAICGNIFMKKEDQAVLKSGPVVIPKSVVVHGDGEPIIIKGADIIFEVNSKQFKLPSSFFRQPLDIPELMKVLPFMVMSVPKGKIQESSLASRLGVYSEP
ncbi:MAG: hypothetical protein WC349_05330 [Patescibacteria group bacterium]|jgi:hypothetical protein